MPTMSGIESAFCRSFGWRLFAGRVVLPWSLTGREPTGRVLEIGCGSGAASEQLLTRYPDIELTAGDYDPEMVDATRRRLAKSGARAHVGVVDATNIDADDASFDTVLSFLMLHHVIEWETAVSEMVRVLRPGGLLIGYDLLSTPETRVIHRVDGSPHRLIERGELGRQWERLPVRVVEMKESRMFSRFVVEASGERTAGGG
ncbi:MAG: class I SAM-dependent methyltransferase [Gordonia sp. (in: high G+C Gram-positive bacteria)]